MEEDRKIRTSELLLSTVQLIFQQIEFGIQLYLSYRLLLMEYWILLFIFSTYLLISSIILNGLSLVWVVSSLDFAGRQCGKVVCYLLHISCLATVWRFIKLLLIRDHTDFREYLMLRFIQIHIQTIPLLMVQIWFLISTPASEIIFLILILVQTITTGSGLALLSEHVGNFLLNSKSSEKRLTNVLKFLTVIESVLLLASRLVALVSFMYIFQYWIILVVLSHCIVSLIFVILLNTGENSAESEVKSVFWVIGLTYLLIFNWPFKCGQKKKQFFVVLTYHLVFAFENVVLLLIWYHYSEQSYHMKLWLTFSAIGCLVIGIGINFIVAKRRNPNVGAKQNKVSDPEIDSSKQIDDRPLRSTNTYINIRDLKPVSPSNGCSELCSTDSSNSRNTNTLLDRSEVISDRKQVGFRESSVTSSFSSLSCGTVLRTAQNSVAAPIQATKPCHCSLFDAKRQYEIYIRDTESRKVTKTPDLFYAQKKFEILCAKCLQSHDPLLTMCTSNMTVQTPVKTIAAAPSCDGSSSTEYPSVTDYTQNPGDDESQQESTTSSTSCTTWPPNPKLQMATLLQKEFSSIEYVKAWLQCSNPPHGNNAYREDSKTTRRNNAKTRLRRIKKPWQRPRSGSLPGRQNRFRKNPALRPNQLQRTKKVVTFLEQSKSEPLVNNQVQQQTIEFIQDLETIV